MSEFEGGVTKAGKGLDGLSWNILGQTYVPKQVCESSFAWHATLPPGTFVPPHIHPTQDEFIFMFEGRLDFVLDGKEGFAEAGDLLKLPLGVPHGLYSKGSSAVQCLFWVTPSRKLHDLFVRLHNLSDPAEVVRISAEHEIHFLPPPE